MEDPVVAESVHHAATTAAAANLQDYRAFVRSLIELRHNR